MYYDEKEAALRVSVTLKKIVFQDWLGYNFTERSANKFVAILEWPDLRIPYKIEFNTVQIVIDNARAELKGQVGFSGAGHIIFK